ncbi:MAG: 16S rRNA (cytosine(1402)-N(4))-methyltransferase [Chlamydiales bacterium]|nr:16S rRNA (cytosine(1402)-N(4))-methyltransferase [Chlamydiales bacterium]
MAMRPFSHIDIAHTFWQKVVTPGDLVVDATAGNGHDCLFLASLGPTRLIAFDIQQAALEATKERLGNFQINLYNICHSRMQEVVEPVSAKLIAFNLGYLPGGNKALTTMLGTTLIALEASLSCLAPGGMLSITCYPGHPEGEVEEKAIMDWVQKLDYKKWSVTSHTFPNRQKHPHLILIQC